MLNMVPGAALVPLVGLKAPAVSMKPLYLKGCHQVKKVFFVPHLVLHLGGSFLS